MALKYMRILNARGYDISRAGLNFKVSSITGTVYMNITELAELAGQPKEFII